jgi:hypothetical protein
VKLGTILGVGQDSQSTFYVADQTADSVDRVFVSSNNTLYRKDVTGSGTRGEPPTVDYTFSFEDPGADAADARSLLIQVRGGAVTAMALGPSDSKAFYAPDAGDESLTVVDPGAIQGFALQDLPGVVEYVADVSNGNVLVVTAPMDASSYSGFRLFYGTQGAMVERTIVAYDQSLSGSADISFVVEAATYTVHFTVEYPAEGGLLGSPGPATLDTGGGATLSVTLRLPTPATLAGFVFSCEGS